MLFPHTSWMTVIKKINGKCWPGCGEKGTLTWIGTVCRFLKKFFKSPIFYSNLTFGYIKNCCATEISVLPDHCSLIHHSQNRQLECPSMDEEYMVYIHKWMLFSPKKKEILPFVTKWANLELIIYTNWNKPDSRDKYGMISFIYGL